MIYAGLLAGIVARYWLWPYLATARLVRQIEAYIRLRNEENQT